MRGGGTIAAQLAGVKRSSGGLVAVVDGLLGTTRKPGACKGLPRALPSLREGKLSVRFRGLGVRD
jgi:hypothetical protein